MSDLNAFMHTKMKDVKEPKIYPAADTIFVITGYRPGRYNNENKTPYVAVTLKPVEVLEGELEAELGEYRTVSYDMPMTDKSKPIARRWLHDVVKLDFDVEVGEEDFSELFELAIGARVRAVTKIIYVGRNKDIPRTDVDRFLPLPD